MATSESKTTFYVIPTTSSPQRLTISLAGKAYNLVLLYHDVMLENYPAIYGVNSVGGTLNEAFVSGWVLDIYDSTNTPIVCGIPLVTGTDLLAQYAYLGIGGSLVVATEGDFTAVPTFYNFGTTSHLYFVAYS